MHFDSSHLNKKLEKHTNSPYLISPYMNTKLFFLLVQIQNKREILKYICEKKLYWRHLNIFNWITKIMISNRIRLF